MSFPIFPTGPVGSFHVVEWTPGNWWVVEITHADGSCTPHAGPYESERAACGALNNARNND